MISAIACSGWAILMFVALSYLWNKNRKLLDILTILLFYALMILTFYSFIAYLFNN